MESELALFAFQPLVPCGPVASIKRVYCIMLKDKWSRQAIKSAPGGGVHAGDDYRVGLYCIIYHSRQINWSGEFSSKYG